ncbi:MAG TPA: DNA methyltransferase [Chloroflexota bacterium]|nr:DNA methyltransferase [Chloroflexota bacterium]
MSWLAEQPNDSFEAVVTDPPYGVFEYSPSQIRKLRVGRGGVWRIPPKLGGYRRSPLPRFTVLDQEQLTAIERFFSQWASALLPKVVPGAHVFIATNPLLSHLVSGALTRAGFEKRGEIVRLTETLRGGDRPKNAEQEFPDVTVMPKSAWEPWLLFRRPCQGTVAENLRRWRTGALRRTTNGPFRDVIISRPTRPEERRLAPHPSLKPQAFMRLIVRAALPLACGTVLDPFAGAGSTLAACDALGYCGVGVEIDSEYVRLAADAILPLAQLPNRDLAEVQSPQARLPLQ